MAVTASDIRNAADLLDGQIIRTPFVAAPMLSRTLGCELMLKLENLQHTHPSRRAALSWRCRPSAPRSANAA